METKIFLIAMYEKTAFYLCQCIHEKTKSNVACKEKYFRDKRMNVSSLFQCGHDY